MEKMKRKTKKKKRNELSVSWKLLFVNYFDHIILVNENRNSCKKQK
jgi:hypothetical protein